MRPERFLAILLPLLLLATPALAQFELDPPKGYELVDGKIPGQDADGMFAHYLEEDPEPDFAFLYHPARTGVFSWETGQEYSTMKIQDSIANSDKEEDLQFILLSIHGLIDSHINLYRVDNDYELTQTLEFPSLSAEYVWLVDLTGDGRSEVVISGMTGISNGGRAFVFRMTDEGMLEVVLEDYDDEDFPQMLWSFYGDIELLRTPVGKWVFKGISPVGRNLTDYFWSWFYEWDEDRGLFVTDGSSYKDEKQKQHDFYLRFKQVLGEFKDDPAVFAASDTEGEFSYGFHDETGDYSLDCFLDEDGSIMGWLVDEAISELDYLLAGPDAD